MVIEFQHHQYNQGIVEGLMVLKWNDGEGRGMGRWKGEGKGGGEEIRGKGRGIFTGGV